MFSMFFLAGPNLAEIFPNTNAAGLATYFREFLGYFVKQFWPGVSTQIDKLYFARIDYPLIVFPFYLLAFTALYSFWKGPSFRRALATGFSSGLLFYFYFHTWAYWLTALGFLFILTLLFLRRDHDRLRGFAVIFIVIGIMALPYLVNYYQFTKTPDHHDFALRLSLSEGREVGLVGIGYDYIAYLFLAAAVFLLYFKRDRQKAILLWAFVAAMFAVWNIQLITGFVPAPDHWTKAVSPTLFIILAIIVYDLAERIETKRHAWRKVFTVVLVVLTVLVVTKKLVNIVSLARAPQPWVENKYFFPKDISDSWDWINNHLGREPKIISSSFMTAQYLAVYTSARPYLPQSIISTLAMRDLEERYLKASRLFKVPDDIIKAQLDSQAPATPCLEKYCYYRSENFGKLTDDLYACFFSRGPFNENQRRGCGRVPDDYKKDLLARYQKTRPTWQDTGADYVYYGPWEKQFSSPRFEKDSKLELVYKNPLVDIYKINK